MQSELTSLGKMAAPAMDQEPPKVARDPSADQMESKPAASYSLGSLALNVAIYGMFGFGNIGNDASLETALHVLNAALPTARFTCIVDDAEAVRARHGAEAVRIYSHPAAPPWWQRLLPGVFSRAGNEIWRIGAARRVVRDLDCVVVAGTGTIDDYYVGPFQHPFHVLKWCAITRSLGKRLEFFCVGSGAIDHKMSRRFFRWALRLAHRRSFRDQQSKEFCRKVLEVDTSEDGVATDIVFALPRKSKALTQRHEAFTVGVGVMDYHNRRNNRGTPDDLYPIYMAKLTEFCLVLLRRGYALRIQVGDLADVGAANDLRARLLAAMPEKEDFVTASPIVDMHELCDDYELTDVAIATRFHNILAALMTGKPCASISYAPKNQALLTEFGLGEYCVDIHDFDVPTLLRKFDAMLEQRGSLSEFVKIHAAQRKEDADLELRSLAQRIRESAHKG